MKQVFFIVPKNTVKTFALHCARLALQKAVHYGSEEVLKRKRKSQEEERKVDKKGRLVSVKATNTKCELNELDNEVPKIERALHYTNK